MNHLLISVKPKYCDMFATGRKTVEIRKSRPRKPVSRIYIYDTGSQRVKVYADVRVISKVKVDTILSLADDDYNKLEFPLTGLTKDEFAEYLNDYEYHYRIKMEKIFDVYHNFALQDLQNLGIRPPQGYFYIPEGVHDDFEVFAELPF